MRKGVILAGGTGSRLRPLTDVTNKHLLPVGKKPMILHLVTKLVNTGIDEIMVITGTEHMGDMISLLGSGQKYGCSFTFKVQESASGIADALRLAENFIGEERFIVLLGDNIFEDDLSTAIQSYKDSGKSCFLLLKKVEDPERYGVAKVEKNKILSIVEKPKFPVSDLCVTGIYMYDSSAFKRIKKLSPSSRGEYEITELNNTYIEEGSAGFSILNGWWTDAGTHSSYRKANYFASRDMDDTQ
jgi:glucose-1-phosphate thymidylyltransferase